MIRDMLRKLRSGAVVSAIWGVGMGVAALVFVAATFLIPSMNPSPEDLIKTPLLASAAGLFLGAVFSATAALGVRDGRLSRWKAGALGILAGAIAAVGHDLIAGQPPFNSGLEGGLLLGLATGTAAFLMMSLVSGSEHDDPSVRGAPESRRVDEPSLEFTASVGASDRIVNRQGSTSDRLV